MFMRTSLGCRNAQAFLIDAAAGGPKTLGSSCLDAGMITRASNVVYLLDIAKFPRTLVRMITLDAPDLIGVKQAATLLGVSPMYIYRHHTEPGWPKSHRYGIRIRWWRDEFIRFRNEFTNREQRIEA